VRDSKSVVQEVQKELLAVVQRGQERVRKGQDRVRKSQEQARKSRDAVVSVVRTGGELAKAARASRPTLPPVRIPSPAAVRAHAQELAGQAITAQRDLADKARHAAGPVAERVLTAQRELTGKARQAGLDHAAAAQRSLAGRFVEVAKVATPIVADGRTRLTQLVSALQSGHQAAAGADATASEVATSATATAEPEVQQQPAAQVETPAEPRTRTSTASTGKTSTAKTGTAKTGTAKTGTAKTGTAKTGTGKSSTAKSSTAKTSTRQAAGSKPRSTPKE
jgi:DNA-binding protein HU-beta